MKKLNTKGFGTVEVLLIILILAVIGGVGVFVMKSKSNSTDKSTNGQSSSSDESANVFNSQYLTFKMWGVRAPIDNGDSLKYSLDGPYATIISKNLADKYDCNTNGAGKISRYKPTDEIFPGTTAQQDYASNPADYKKIGDYYFQFTHDQDPCSSKTGTGTAGATAQTTANDYTRSLNAKLESL